MGDEARRHPSGSKADSPPRALPMSLFCVCVEGALVCHCPPHVRRAQQAGHRQGILEAGSWVLAR